MTKRRLRLVGDAQAEAEREASEGVPVRCAVAGVFDDSAANRFAERLRFHALALDPAFPAHEVAVGAAHLARATLSILVTGPTVRSAWPAERRALQATLELAEPRDEVARALAAWLVRG